MKLTPFGCKEWVTDKRQCSNQCQKEDRNNISTIGKPPLQSGIPAEQSGSHLYNWR